MDIMKDAKYRKRRAYEVLDDVQANLDELDRRYQRKQMIKYLDYLRDFLYLSFALAVLVLII